MSHAHASHGFGATVSENSIYADDPLAAYDVDVAREAAAIREFLEKLA